MRSKFSAAVSGQENTCVSVGRPLMLSYLLPRHSPDTTAFLAPLPAISSRHSRLRPFMQPRYMGHNGIFRIAARSRSHIQAHLRQGTCTVKNLIISNFTF